LLLLLLPILLSAVAVLGIVVFREALHTGDGEAWLAAWVLAFVVGLPVSIVALAVAGAVQGRTGIRGIVPSVGVKIPGEGQ
jgi:hypothetical protein